MRTELRRRAGLTLYELGRRVDKSAGTLSLWERGQLELASKDVEKIASVIETELSKFSALTEVDQIVNVLSQSPANRLTAGPVLVGVHA